jgi:hypothetical protein
MAEAHGVLLPLDEANLALLDLRTEADPIVRRVDLPGAVGDGDESVVDPSDDPVDDLLRSAPEGAHPELDAARRHHHDTREALRVLREMAEETARLLDESADERRRLSDVMATVSVGVDPTQSDVDEVAALESELAALAAGIAELTALDLEPVRVLLDAIERPEPVQEVPHPAAQALAAEIVRLHGEVAALEARMEAEGRGPVTALARLDTARAEAVTAEASLVRPPVSTDDEAALRAAHEEVLDAERKASGFRSRSGQRKLAAALGLQQEILDRVGFPTWSAYIMGASLMGVDAGAKARLEAAELELSAAEEAWTRISAALEADPDHHALLDQLEEVEVNAISVLLESGASVPDEREDLEHSLLALRAPAQSATEDDLVATLAHSLHNLGLQVEPSQPERVLVTAHALLEEFAGVPARVEELTAERRRLESKLADARSRAEAKAWEDLEAAVDRPATERIAEIEAELAATRAAEEDLVEALEARHALVEAATLAERAASRRARATGLAVLELHTAAPAGDADELWSEVDPEAIELYLMARLSAIRQVSYAGSVPLVLVDTFRGLPDAAAREVLAAVARMSQNAQILVLTNDALVAAWAVEQGDERAAVVSVAPVYV